MTESSAFPFESRADFDGRDPTDRPCACPGPFSAAGNPTARAGNGRAERNEDHRAHDGAVNRC